MSFKDISYLELWRPFCSAEWNHLDNFGRGYQKEQFYKIILNLDQCSRRRCHLKYFLSETLAAFLFDGAKPFFVILNEDIMWTSGLGEDVI